jgi:hypothetical protein
LTRRAVAGVFAALTMGLAHSYWQLSVVTETYTLSTALMTIEWAVLLRYGRTSRPLLMVALFAVNGLHIANHLLGTLTLATYGVLLVWAVARKRLAMRWAATAILAWIVMASPYWALVLAHWQQHGDLADSLHSAFFGEGVGGKGYAREVFNVAITPAVLKDALLLLGYNLPSLGGLVALVGLVRKPSGRDTLFQTMMIAQTAIIVPFVIRYSIADVYTYFVPVVAVAGLWAGIGAGRLLSAVASRPRRIVLTYALLCSALLPIGIYLWFPWMARQRGWFAGRLGDLPYREKHAYYFRPWRFGEDSAARVSRDLIRLAGPEGWILADASTAYAVAYTRWVQGWREEARVYAGPVPLGIDEPISVHVDVMREHLARGGRAVGLPFSGEEPDWGMFHREPLGEQYWELRPAE